MHGGVGGGGREADPYPDLRIRLQCMSPLMKRGTLSFVVLTGAKSQPELRGD
jgi:hypothetical protein